MVRSLRSHAPFVAFGLSLTVVYGVALTLVSRLASLDRPDLIAGALTVDLTLLVPLLYYLLLVRWRGWPLPTVLPVFLASVALAHGLIPDSRHHVLDLMDFGIAAAEIALVGILVHKVIALRRAYRERTSTGLDVYSGLREGARPLLGPVAGTALAYEVAVFYYLLFGWRRAGEPGPSSFTCHRKIAYGAVVIAVMMAGTVELVAVHLLVSLWSPLVAWILTGISAYALLWVIGDSHAIRLRPIELSASTLHIRLGLRWTMDVPLDSIVKVGTIDRALPRRTPAYLKAVLLGAPNTRIELSAPAEALGPYGLTRRVTTIDLQLDEPAGLRAALKKNS